MHPSDRQLIEYLFGGEGAATTEQHLLEPCTRCAARVRDYETLVQTMRSDRTPEPPVEWVERAIALRSAGSVQERIARWCEGLRERVARLVHDSAAEPGFAAAGTRLVAGDRRLRFESEEIELDIHLEPLGRGGVLTGQISKLDPTARPVPGARLLVTAGDLEIHEAGTDELGEFCVELSRLRSVRVRTEIGGMLVSFTIPDVGILP
jgi:hypothetical protein